MQAEITDIKISSDAKKMASSSNDGSIRVWSLDQKDLGFPLSVLKARPDRASVNPAVGGPGPSPGLAANRSSSASDRRNLSSEAAANPASNVAVVADANAVSEQNGATQFVINFLDWNPVVPNALAAVSSDGICRIWDTVTGMDPVELRPANAFGRPPFIPARISSQRGADASPSVGPVPSDVAEQAGPSTAVPADAPSPGPHQHSGSAGVFVLYVLASSYVDIPRQVRNTCVACAVPNMINSMQISRASSSVHVQPRVLLPDQMTQISP